MHDGVMPDATDLASTVEAARTALPHPAVPTAAAGALAEFIARVVVPALLQRLIGTDTPATRSPHGAADDASHGPTLARNVPRDRHVTYHPDPCE